MSKPTVKQTQFDRRVVIATGSKGSCGKSTILLQLVDWMREHPAHPTMAVFDPDNEHRTLERAFGAVGAHPLPAPHVFERLDWRGDDGQVVIDRVVRVLYSTTPNPPVVSLVDGVANQMKDVLEWATLTQIFQMGEELGFRVTFLLCVDEVEDSATAASKLLNTVGAGADYVVVRNLKSSSTLPWDSTPARKKAADLGAVEISIEGFTADLKAFVQGRADGAPHSVLGGVNQKQDGFLTRRALSVWSELTGQLSKAERLLLPPQCWSDKKS
jgi:hypothetical protein